MRIHPGTVLGIVIIALAILLVVLIIVDTARAGIEGVI